MSRDELVAAADAAADAFASGAPTPQSITALAGRAFELRLPFGCDGPLPAQSGETTGYSYDEKTQTLKAVVAPQTWTDAPWIQSSVPTQQLEAVEGFWIARPWARSAVCPKPIPAAGNEAADASAETLAIAQAIEPGARRESVRNGKPYVATAKVDPEHAPAGEGLRLVVTGRMIADPARPPVVCWSNSADRHPICTIWARFDRIAITDASGDTRYAEWGS